MIFNPISIIFSLSFIAILIAHTVEILGFPPCTLCYYQRIPYYFLVCYSILYIALPQSISPTFFKKSYLYVALIAMSIELCIAFFHFGVENAWFSYEAACTGKFPYITSIEEMAHNLEIAPLVSCLSPAVVVLGISMTGWNVIFSIAFLGFIVYTIYRHSSKFK